MPDPVRCSLRCNGSGGASPTPGGVKPTRWRTPCARRLASRDPHRGRGSHGRPSYGRAPPAAHASLAAAPAAAGRRTGAPRRRCVGAVRVRANAPVDGQRRAEAEPVVRPDPVPVQTRLQTRPQVPVPTRVASRSWAALGPGRTSIGDARLRQSPSTGGSVTAPVAQGRCRSLSPCPSVCSCWRCWHSSSRAAAGADVPSRDRSVPTSGHRPPERSWT